MVPNPIKIGDLGGFPPIFGNTQLEVTVPTFEFGITFSHHPKKVIIVVFCATNFPTPNRCLKVMVLGVPIHAQISKKIPTHKLLSWGYLGYVPGNMLENSKNFGGNQT